jgi:translocation and assembly module TamB
VALRRPVRNFRAEATLQNLAGGLDGTLRLRGEVDSKALRGEVNVRRPEPQTWLLDRLAFSLGSCTIEGRAAVDTDNLLSEGAITLWGGNLDDLSALALSPLAGSLNAAITLTREGGRQNAVIRATTAVLLGLPSSER